MRPKIKFYEKEVFNNGIIGSTSLYSTDPEVLMLEDVINGMIDCIRVIDLNGIIIYINKAMADKFGYSIIGKKCYEACGKNQPCENCVSSKSLLDGKSHEKEEIFGQRYFSIKGSPVKNKYGEITAVVEVLRDITNEKLLNKKIVDKNTEHRADINLAKKIQMSFLPTKFPEERVELSYIYKPCDELGGDFIDTFMIDEDNLGIYIADVAGHGVTASLLTVFLRSSFDKTILSPSKALANLYKEFNAIGFNAVGFDATLYITVFYSVINLKNKTITYANAGHNICPIVFSDTGFNLLRNAGLPICNWAKDPYYPEKTHTFHNQDTMFFCTDGIIEARNKENVQFGEERLLKILMSKKESLNIILNDIMNQASKFIEVDGKSIFEDDITMALLKIIEK